MGGRLGTEEGGAAFGKAEAGDLLFYDAGSGLPYGRQMVAEGHIVVAYLKFDFEDLPLGVGQGEQQHIGFVVHFGMFDAVLLVMLAYMVFATALQLQVRAEIRNGTDQSQRGVLEHYSTLVTDAVKGLSIDQADLHFQLTVGTAYFMTVILGQYAKRKKEECTED